MQYEKKDYLITNTEVTQDEIQTCRAKCYRLVVVDSESGKLVKVSNAKTKTLAFLSVYQTSDKGLCIGVNDKYFKLIPKNSKTEEPLLDLARFSKTTENSDENFRIDDKDARKIHYGDELYQITTSPVADENLGDYQATLAEVRIFETQTGKVLSQSDLLKIDNGGKLSNQDRNDWFYGDIYSLKDTSMNETFAIEINHQFVLAQLIKN